MAVTWFNENASPKSIGGKGFHLCGLTRAGLPTPSGFCIPWNDSKEIGRNEIGTALTRLGVRAVAVRSSAIEEDGIRSSFAGVYLTRLNVVGPEAVTRAVQEVAQSSLSPDSVTYRRKRGIGHPPKMAVVVQEFVRAEASGVLFMKSPVDRSERVIVEGSWGLGEAVVTGMVTPDRWVLSPEGTVISASIADKDVAVVPDEVGTKVTEVSTGRRKAPSLDTRSLHELVQLAKRCGELFGGAQDIEWALASNRIWLIQSRPISGTDASVPR